LALCITTGSQSCFITPADLLGILFDTEREQRDKLREMRE